MTAMPSELVRNAHLHAKVEKAIDLVKKALAEEGPVREMEDADTLERTVVMIRDALIDLVRHDPDAKERKKAGEALERVNPILSLIAGVEYPSKGPEAELLKETKESLRRLLRLALFRTD